MMNEFMCMPEDNLSNDFDPCYRFPSPSSPSQQDQQLEFPLTTTTTTTPPAHNEGAAMMANSLSSDLSDILAYYRSHPDLLRLILMSKVEEDKRRTEEAKLRQKELDLLLQQQQQALNQMLAEEEEYQQQRFSLPSGRRPGDFEEYDVAIFDNHRRESTTPPLMMESTTAAFSPSSSASSPTSLFNISAPTSSTNTEGLGPPSPFYFYKPEPAVSTAAGTTSTMVVDKSCSLTEKHHPYHRANAPRRRREMQAITKIVETREFPYVDGYFWKNNGNTVQKRTGNKSIYYKCSNSSKGCAVNKTVTWKANGEYLIKYRGEHLLECGKVERIIEV